MKALLKKFFDLFSSLFKKKNETVEAKNTDLVMKTLLAFLLAGGSILLTIFNIVNENMIMMWSTIGLAVGFLIAALVIGAFKNRLAGQIIIGILLVGVFSFYAWIGGNDGFAILWIVLVPLLSMQFLTFPLGFGLSIYFLLYLIVILYILPAFGIPIGGGFYNTEFLHRFPVMYFISFCMSLFISVQKVYYSNKAQETSLYDPITGLRNRKYFSDFILSVKKMKPDFTVIVLNFNNLRGINDKYGHEEGNNAIVKVAGIITDTFGKFTENMYRTGANEFHVFMEDKNNIVDNLIDKVRALAASTKIQKDRLSVSGGYIKSSEYRNYNLQNLIATAERKMRQDKEDFYMNYQEF